MKKECTNSHKKSGCWWNFFSQPPYVLNYQHYPVQKKKTQSKLHKIRIMWYQGLIEQRNRTRRQLATVHVPTLPFRHHIIHRRKVKRSILLPPWRHASDFMHSWVRVIFFLFAQVVQCIQFFFSKTLFDFKKSISGLIELKFSGKTSYEVLYAPIYFWGVYF